MKQEYLDILTNIIGAVESGGQIYGNRDYSCYAGKFKNSDKEYTCTLGWAANYGNEAKKLCNMIFTADPVAFRQADSANIESRLNRDWVAEQWDPSPAEKTALIAIITTPAGKQCQDKLFQQLIEGYIKHAENYGVTSIQAQMMWCEIEHLGGLGPVKRIFTRAAQPYTPDSIFASLLLDQQDTSSSNQVGDKKFQTRHECCVRWIKQYVTEEKEVTVKMSNPIEKLLATAAEEVGYLEKKSNKDLDDKTANAGSNNYTKYTRDIKPSYQPCEWCDMFVDWCFNKTFGTEVAKKMTFQTAGWSSYTPDSSSYYKNNGHWHTTPQAGDQVFFHNNVRIRHTGIVERVTDTGFYTYEGNTSDGSAMIPNGGSVCHKFYPFNHASIAGFGRPDWSLVQGNKYTKGWNRDDKGWWYVYDDNDSYYKNQWALIDHYWYLFDKDGYMLTGWQKWDSEKKVIGEGEWYYLNETDSSDQGQCWHETKEFKGAMEPWYVA